MRLLDLFGWQESFEPLKELQLVSLFSLLNDPLVLGLNSHSQILNYQV